MIDTNIVNGEFNFIKSISDLYKELVAKFNGKSELDLNASIVEIGRTEEEKGQLQEMCDDMVFCVSYGKDKIVRFSYETTNTISSRSCSLT